MESANSCGWLQATKLMVWILLLSSCFTSTNQEEIIPGCFLKPNNIIFEKPGCERKPIMTNYCEGYCKSKVYPSSEKNITTNVVRKLISKAQCCVIKESVNKQITLDCYSGFEQFTIMEAASCECSHCDHS